MEKFAVGGDEWDHDLGPHVDPAPRGAHRGLEDGARLHLRDLGIGDAQPASAVTEHRIHFPQVVDDATELLLTELQRLSEVPALFSAVWQEFMKRRVQETDGDREPIHRFEDRLEIRSLHGQQLGERAASAGDITRYDHLAHGGDPVALEEHVLRAAEPDPLRPERSRDARVTRCVGIGSHPKPADCVRPFEHAREGLIEWRIGRPLRPGHDAHDFARDGWQRAAIDRATGAVDCQPISFLYDRPIDLKPAMPLVDMQVLAADHRALAHSARHDGRVARHPAACRDHSARGDNPAKVLWSRFVADQDHRLAIRPPLCSDVRIEDRHPARGARTRRQPAAERCRAHACIDDRVQQLVDLVGRNAAHGFGRVDQPLRDHVARDADGGRCGPFTVSRLQKVEATPLDGELQILHVAEMPLESLLGRLELSIRTRESGGHVGDGQRGAEPCDDVLTLGVDQEFAVEHALARRRIASERHTSAGIVSEVAEDHGDDADARAQRVGNTVHASIIDSLSQRPRPPHRLDGTPELTRRVRREIAACRSTNERLVLLDEVPKRGLVELGVGRNAQRPAVWPSAATRTGRAARRAPLRRTSGGTDDTNRTRTVRRRSPSQVRGRFGR